MKIGKRLKELRKRLNLTQKELANKVKDSIDYTYIGKIERSEQNPSLGVLEKIAQATNIDMVYFFSSKPIELYLKNELNQNKVREALLEDLCQMDKKELEFLSSVIGFINGQKYSKKRLPPLKAAEKKNKYK